ncbi:MAG TPA: hypothetical protein VD905_00655 [Flavobacteriales bacterium]|nr:hypothetical protein [Flavobacteriales bacterium]
MKWPKKTDGQVVHAVSSNWKLRKVGDSKWIDSVFFPATIHEILFQKKLIPDPYYGNNEKDLKWIEESDWEAEAQMDTFAASLPNHELVFEGLSPYAKVYFNGTFLFESQNEFVEYKKDITALYNNKGNTVRIVFESPVRRGRALMQKHNAHLPGDERVYTRKPQYEYGWDWGPRFVTSGIRKWCYCISRPEHYTEFREIGITTQRCSKQKADLLCEIEVSTTQEGPKYISINVDWKNCLHQKVMLKKGLNVFRFPVTVQNPLLWWPKNMGIPGFCFIEFVIGESKKPRPRKVIDRHVMSYAICDIKLVNENEKGFYFSVNGIPTYIKGFNDIPGDHFNGHYLTQQKSSIALDYLVWSGANMVRVWGGGDYPSEQFMDYCMHNGIMVWQDFMFACAMYPGDTGFLNNVKTEVTQQVKRLRSYGNLALWCGNNENDEGWKNWGWQKQYNYTKTDSAQLWNDYKKLFHDIIPVIIHQYDPSRAYIPSSPEIGWGHKESLKQGDSHYWGVWWGKEPIETFGKKIPRFMSEFGMQAMPDLSTLQKVIPDSLMHFSTPEFTNHQKHPAGFETLDHYLNEYLLVPHKMDDYAYATQVLQAMTLKTAIEAQRTAKPHCMGTLVWQLNDSWPVTSWSVVDYYAQAKIGYEQVKESFANKLLTIKEDSGDLLFYCVNDDTSSFTDSLEWSICYFNGKKAFEGKEFVRVNANNSTNIFTLSQKNMSSLNKKEIYLYAKLGHSNCQQVYHFVKPNEMNLPKADYTITVRDTSFEAQPNDQASEKYMIRLATITANTYMPWTRFMNNDLKDICFSEPIYYDFPLKLLPGDSHQFIINCETLKTPEQTEAYIRQNLKCLNTLLNKN